MFKTYLLFIYFFFIISFPVFSLNETTFLKDNATRFFISSQSPLNFSEEEKKTLESFPSTLPRIEAGLLSVDKWPAEAAAGPPVHKRSVIEVDQVTANHFRFFIDTARYDLMVKEKPLVAKRLFRRALLAAYFYQLDKKYGWSKTKEWYSINRWQTRSEQPILSSNKSENTFENGFAEKWGMKSPQKDLVSFLARFSLPDPEDNSKGDDSLACRFLAQSHFVLKNVFSRLPDYPLKTREPAALCPAFEKWAKFDQIEYLEIMMGAPSTVFIGSLFGHVFLRVVENDGQGGMKPIFFTRTFGFLANTHGPIEADPFFNIKGIFGAYKTILLEQPFQILYRQYAVMEDRDMERWRMNLTPDQIRAVLVRLWSTQKSSIYRYYFFEENCGTFLYKLLEGALIQEGVALKYPRSIGSLPAATIDGYLQARFPDGTPLLDKISDKYISFKTEMLHAEKVRIRLSKQIRRMAKEYFDPLGAGKLRRAVVSSGSEDVQQRLKAYELIKTFTGKNQALDQSIGEYFRISRFVENYFNVQQNIKIEKEVNKDRVKRLKEKIGLYKKSICTDLEKIAAKSQKLAAKDTDSSSSKNAKFFSLFAGKCDKAKQLLFHDELALRLKGYERFYDLYENVGQTVEETSDLKLKQEIEKWQKRVLAMKVMKAHDAFDLHLVKEKDFFVLYHETISETKGPGDIDEFVSYIFINNISDALLTLVKLWSEVSQENAMSSTKPVKFKENRPQMSSHTGVAMFSLQPYYRNLDGANLYGVYLNSALVEEELGDRRVVGFPFYSGMTVLESNLWVDFSGEAPEIGQYHLQIIDMTLLEPGITALSNSKLFGYRLRAHSSYYNNYSPFWEFALEGGLLAPLIRGDFFSYYLLFTPGIYAQRLADMRNVVVAYMFGVPLGLQVRFPIASGGLDYLAAAVEFVPAYDMSLQSYYQYYTIKGELSYEVASDFRLSEHDPYKTLRFFMEAGFRNQEIASTWRPVSYEYTINLGLRLN